MLCRQLPFHLPRLRSEGSQAHFSFSSGLLTSNPPTSLRSQRYPSPGNCDPPSYEPGCLGYEKSTECAQYGLPGCLAWGLRGMSGQDGNLPSPNPKKETFPQQGWGLRMPVWWALSSPRVTGVHLPEVHSLSSCRVPSAVLGSREAAEADTESKALVSSLCGCGTWGWQRCGGAAESEPQPIGLSRAASWLWPGVSSGAGMLGVPAVCMGAPVCSPPQADSAGQQGRCPHHVLWFGCARPGGACGVPVPWGSGVSYAAW